MAAWGDVAVGECRGTRDDPGASAIQGLLAAALGIHRDNEATHDALRDGYALAVGTIDGGALLRDFHTAQVPGRSEMKQRLHRTRRDELLVPKFKLNTILSTRDYRQGGAWLVAVQSSPNPPYALSDLQAALREPHFLLYLGRKSCPPCAPLAPQVLTAASVMSAMETYLIDLGDREGLNRAERLNRLAWANGVDAGLEPDLSVPRKDRLVRRRGWQFGDRTEYVALMAEDD